MRFSRVNSVQEVGLQALHRARDRLIWEQTEQINQAAPSVRLSRMNRLRFFWTRIWGKNIVQWAGRVAELDECYRPFADQLRLLAKGYQSKAILILVERYIETRSGA